MNPKRMCDTCGRKRATYVIRGRIYVCSICQSYYDAEGRLKPREQRKSPIWKEL